MLQLTRSDVISADSDALTAYREEFAQRQCVVLPQFLEASLLQDILKFLETAAFVPRVDIESAGGTFAREICVPGDEPVVGLLRLVCNRPKLFTVIQHITQCPSSIGCFDGRLYRMLPHTDHFDSWHGDGNDNRLIGLSINLNPAGDTSGVFYIRERRAKQLLGEVSNTAFGDAHLFHIAPHLEHRVLFSDSDAPRTAYAGWFRSQPDYREILGLRVPSGDIEVQKRGK